MTSLVCSDPSKMVCSDPVGSLQTTLGGSLHTILEGSLQTKDVIDEKKNRVVKKFHLVHEKNNQGGKNLQNS